MIESEKTIRDALRMLAIKQHTDVFAFLAFAFILISFRFSI